MTIWRDVSDFPIIYPPILVIVIATIAGLIILRRAHARPDRRQGLVYSFPKRLTERQILHALGKVSPLRTAILKFIVDGYLEGVDSAAVAAHFNIRKTEAARHLKTLHRLGLLYIKRCRGRPASFHLIESVMARIGEPRFFDLIGLGGFA